MSLRDPWQYSVHRRDPMQRGRKGVQRGRVERDSRSRSEIPVYSEKGVAAPGSFLRSLSGRKTLEASWGSCVETRDRSSF